MSCVKCGGKFCYICNKPIEGESHYETTATCRAESDPITDL